MVTEEHTPSPQEARGIYGFVLFLFMKTFLISYFIWMFLPVSVIQSLPYAPPQQYWGIAVPVFICTALFVFPFCIYPAFHGLHDCEFDEPSALTDPDAHSEHYFDQVRAQNQAKVGWRKRKDVGGVGMEGGCMKSFQISSEMYEKSKTLTAREKQFRDMQIRPIRAFPASDTRPIPPVSDLELDMVCKRLYLQEE